MLRAYFGDAEWITPLLVNLDALPDGMAWMRNPVLLGLAASLYQKERVLPDATLDLYGRVIGHMLAGLAWPVEELLPALQRQARRMLLPETGDPTVTVREGDLPYQHRDAMLASGLFTGDQWLRFAHLTLGEYLAAGAEGIDLARERRRERARPEGRADDESALDVVAMAHAMTEASDVFWEDVPLVAAFGEARNDTPGHRMLRLVLRAVGYGGKLVGEFCEREGEALLGILAARMQAPSGRFGDFERLLMGDAERALLVLRPHTTQASERNLEAQLAPALTTLGEAGTEANITLWNLRVRVPVRRSSRWWPTVERQARAMVRAGLDVDRLFELTEGSDDNSVRATAVQVLAGYDEYWLQLRPLFDDRSMHVREAMVRHLADNPRAEQYIRERLDDDDGIVRRSAARVLAIDPERRRANFDRLLSCINSEDNATRGTTIHYLKDDQRALVRIRDFLRLYLTWSMHDSRDEAVGALANDPESTLLIRQFLEEPKTYYGRAFSYLGAHAEWWPLLRKRLDRPDPEPGAIEALAKDDSARNRIRELLEHQSPYVRTAAVVALGDDSGSREKIVTLLQDADPWVRMRCVEALGEDPAMLARIERVFLDDHEQNPKMAAIRVLAKHPASMREFLWNYFDKTKNETAHGHVSYDWLRASIVIGLRNDSASTLQMQNALDDPHAQVRKAAINALASFASARDKIRERLTDSDLGVRTAALLALKDDRSVREQIVPHLRGNEETVCIVALRLLVGHAGPRHRMRQILDEGPENRRSTTVQPLAYDMTSRGRLYDCLSDKNGWVSRVAASVLRRTPEAKRRLRAVLEKHIGDTRRLHNVFSWEYVVQSLADDPDAHPIFLKMSYANDNNVVAVVVPALANYPVARPRLREILGNEDAVSNERAAAVAALAGDSESRATILSLLKDEDADEHVRAAAIGALASDTEARPSIRELLSHPRDKEIRRAASYVLAQDPSARSLLFSHLREEAEDDIRTSIIVALAEDPQVVPMLHERLRDPSSSARVAAARALRVRPTPAGLPLQDIPSLRLALHLAGNDPAPTTPLPSLSLRDRLEAFVNAPRPLRLDADPAFAEALLGWLCARLCWAADGGAFRDGRVFGEVEHEVPSLLALDEPLVIRVAMDSSELPRERFLHPAHNLIEAWHVATHLSAAKPPAIFLACADVAFEHLTAPDVPPGEVCWGPGFFGFRLREATTEPLDPMEWLVSSEARDVWLAAEETTRARYLETLSRMANLASLDSNAVVPVLSRVGDLLPLSLQAAFAQRFPRTITENVVQQERAARLLGARTPGVAPALVTPAEPSSTGARVQLQQALDVVRAALRGSGTIEPAIEAFERVGESLHSPDNDAERDDAVLDLCALRNRISTAEQARRVLAVATAIDAAKLKRVARRALNDLISWLRTWRTS